MKKILTKKGFTLIELIVVIAILAILAAILIPSVTYYINESTKAKNLANARSLYSQYTLALNLTPKTDPANTIVAATAGANRCVIRYDGAYFLVSTKVVSITCGVTPTAQTFTP